MSDPTLATLFEASAAAHGDRVALRSKRGSVWNATTWSVWRARVRALAAELVERGVQRGDRVALFGTTREESLTAEMAVLLAGAVVVPVYPTLAGDQAAHLLRDSGARVLFVEDGALLGRVLDAAPDAVAKLAAIVTFDDSRLSPLPTAVRAKTLSWRALMARAETRDGSGEPEVTRRAAEIVPSDLATIIYTSGTTGLPKGVSLTHASFVFETGALLTALDVGPTDEQLLFLPLAHVFAQILVFGMVRSGGAIAFAESLVKALENAAEVSPTFMASVPRFYEKLHAFATEKAHGQGTVKARVFDWAVGIGREHARLEERGKKARGYFAIERHYADRLVLRTVRERFGTRLRFAISGGAPLARELHEWFWGCGVKVVEGYGLTETTAATNLNTLRAYRFGTVGRALPGVEVKTAPDGEVLVRGPNVTRGYFNRDADTREALDEGGWLHTGDVGAIDGDGYLTITDRKKDILVTAGGKNIAPQNIETILGQSPWINHAVVCGDRRPYLVALVTLDLDAMKRFAAENAREPDLATLARDPEVRARVQLEVDAVNRRLSQFETIKRFAILPRDFSVEDGELTPTLKVRRSVIAQRHAAEIDALYA